MICCPNCDHDNIEGVDVCDRCGQPLSDLHLGDPKTDVERSLLLDRVSILWPRPPIVVAPDMRVHDVLRLLVDREIGCVFIVSADQKVTGVFSERDALLRLNTQARDHKDRPISDVTTPTPQRLAADATVAIALPCTDLGG
jgi:CBS domain-containing protein